MGMAKDQETLPAKPSPSEGWSFRRLFSAPVATAFTKVFVNPFEWLLCYMLLVIGAAELLEKHVSLFFYAMTFFLFVAALITHLGNPLTELSRKKEKTEK